MLTVNKLSLLCSRAAVLAGCWLEWREIRDSLMVQLTNPSFREACLLALRHPSIGLTVAANRIQYHERNTEKRLGDGCIVFADDVILNLS